MGSLQVVSCGFVRFRCFQAVFGRFGRFQAVLRRFRAVQVFSGGFWAVRAISRGFRAVSAVLSRKLVAGVEYPFFCVLLCLEQSETKH